MNENIHLQIPEKVIVSKQKPTETKERVDQIVIPNQRVAELKEKAETLYPGAFNHLMEREFFNMFLKRIQESMPKCKHKVFGLHVISSLLTFEDLFDDSHKYKGGERTIVHVNANNSSYQIKVGNHKVLFTYKLTYYVRLLESEVNRNMNDVFALLNEERARDGDISEMLKQTRESIRCITKIINKFFQNFDRKGQLWGNISSESPDLKACRSFKEMIVFYHYFAAQMCRYTIELDKRYGNGAGLEDVFLFYSEDLQRSPDTGIIDILPAIKPDEATAECKKNTNTQKKSTATKKGKKKGSFIINENEEDRKDTISALSTKLCDTYHLIREEDKRTLECLLSGVSSTKTIQWPHEQRKLLGLLFQDMRAITTVKGGKRKLVSVGKRGSIEEEQRLVTTTNGADPWTDVVYQWFVDEDGVPYSKEHGKLKDAGHAQKWDDTLDDLLSVFHIEKEQTISKFR